MRRRGVDFTGFAFPKGRTQREARETKREQARDRTEAVRRHVMGRERGECRCCREFFDRLRPAQSMHEIRFRSLGGLPSPENSIAVCGSGTTGCHGLLQRHAILVEVASPRGAEDPQGLRFVVPYQP